MIVRRHPMTGRDETTHLCDLLLVETVDVADLLLEVIDVGLQRAQMVSWIDKTRMARNSPGAS
jgi:hypothetical protein